VVVDEDHRVLGGVVARQVLDVIEATPQAS
jgi:osmoprotectant transport system ATP-binding protein